MSTETFLSYRSYRWLWLNIGFLLGLAILYLLDHPVGGRNGGTVLGYTYGAIGALGILYLMWFGVRKRAYDAKRTTLKGCLSAHVWIGCALVLIVPLHCAFSFGLNVHTLAYVLMLAVIFSGMWGARNYISLPPDFKSQRGGGTTKKLLEQLHIISMDIGGLGSEKSDQFMALIRKTDFDFKPSIWKSLFGVRPQIIDKIQSAELLATLPEKEQSNGLKLISMVNKKKELAAQVQDEVAVLTKMRIWLYLHLPLSFALLAALFIHIISVFYYW